MTRKIMRTEQQQQEQEHAETAGPRNSSGNHPNTASPIAPGSNFKRRKTLPIAVPAITKGLATDATTDVLDFGACTGLPSAPSATTTGLTG